MLTADQYNEQFRDNLLNLRGNSACAENGVSGTSSAQTVLFGDCRWAAEEIFDIHDDVTQSATIADADLIPFSDEGSAGDPMRYTTTANLLIPARLGTGTPSSDTFLRGDGTWAELPTQYVLALDQDSTTTSSASYVDAGAPLTIGLVSGSVSVYVTGDGTGSQFKPDS